MSDRARYTWEHGLERNCPVHSRRKNTLMIFVGVSPFRESGSGNVSSRPLIVAWVPTGGSMLLWFGKWVRGTVLDDQGGQRVEDLAGDVALQAADDLGLRQAFVGAALGVGAGAGVVAEAAKNDNVERVVGATVAAAIEPVAVGASAAGGDRCGAAEVREGGFGLDPVKLSPALMSTWPATSGPTPGRASRAGAACCTS